ncbi:MAG: hypothetical protein ABIR32_13360 [Ilumatobacteraceae bacterium]
MNASLQHFTASEHPSGTEFPTVEAFGIGRTDETKKRAVHTLQLIRFASALLADRGWDESRLVHQPA